MATAYAGLGDEAKSCELTERCFDLDPARAPYDVRAIAAPFFHEPGLAPAGVAYFRRLERRLPGAPWVRTNIERLEARERLHSLAPSAR